MEEKLADPGDFGIGGEEIIGADLGMGERRRKAEEQCRHRVGITSALRSAIAALAIGAAGPAAADMEEARDLMEEGRFEEARALFDIYARSGNADAEELIGVMYAMGLGVERDDRRAFEWYLRSSLKGHAGAQSGLGWYYETGRGLPAPDLVRAYLWYALSSIGGDVDAPDSLAEVAPRLSAEERRSAEALVEDYRRWMYPFR